MKVVYWRWMNETFIRDGLTVVMTVVVRQGWTSDSDLSNRKCTGQDTRLHVPFLQVKTFWCFLFCFSFFNFDLHLCFFVWRL